MNVSKFMLTAALVSAPAVQASAEWVSIGTGVYHEDLLTYYEDEIERGLVWNVEVEENSETPGLYRFIPYHSNTPIAEYMGQADATYIVIHAEDPAKVWMEDADFYEGFFCFSHCVAETGWSGDDLRDYGTLEDGCISFPAMSIATLDIYDEINPWHSANRNGEFKLYLPGNSTIEEDYSLYLKQSYCGPDDNVPVTITAGASTAEVKYLLKPGVIGADDIDFVEIASEGTVTPTGECTFKCPARGVYTLAVAALDADGNTRTVKAATIYGVTDDDAAWKSHGKTTYNESFVAGYYDYMEECELEVEFQESVTTPGYYRIVNPYATHEYNEFAAHEGHNHYIYIHAEDPDFVYIENTPIGTDFGYGEGHVTSSVAMALEMGLTLDEIKAEGTEAGKVIDGVIQFPDWGLWYGELDYFNGDWTATGEHFRVKIPASAGVDNVAADDDTTAPEYYDLRGIRLQQRPAKGLYIEKRGEKANVKL